MSALSQKLAIYIHWPFCASKCPYCDFNSHVREGLEQSEWVDAYLRELSFYAALMPERQISSLFFGGGTPSLMAPESVARIIGHIQTLWHIDNQCEITLEANPTSIEADKFLGFAAAGVNRVSVGVQSLNDADLTFLGRKHSAEEALRALDIAGDVFERFSFDLIYARPEQSLEGWREELSKALEIGAPHMSLYQLTIERGTAFYTSYRRGDFSLPDDMLAADFYELTQEMMAGAGLQAYEVSNHAVAGGESAHNLTYWHYGDYIGVGAGAHGRILLPDGRRVATRTHLAPEAWLKRVQDSGDGLGTHPFEEITPDEAWAEALMMGLRLYEGVSLARLEAVSGGRRWQDLLDERKIEVLQQEGLLRFAEQDDLGAVLLPSRTGIQKLNGILRFLL